MEKMQPQILLAQVKQAVHEIEPDAEIILYGSRARGDAQPDSDWDLLILVDGVARWEQEEKISHCLFHLELEWNEVLLPIVRGRQEWNSPRYRATPFYQSVSREGVRL